MPARQLVILNHKGGVGKTTTALNLAYAFARRGFRTLALDLDVQAHLSISMGLSDHSLSGMDQVFLQQLPLTDFIHPIEPRLGLVPAGEQLAEVEKLAAEGPKVARILEHAVAQQAEQYDFILFDCPPTSGLLNLNALFAANEVLVPVSSDFLSLNGLSQLMKTLRSAERFLAQPLEVYLVLTRFFSRRKLSKQVREQLLDYFPQQLLATVIRETAAVAESPRYGQCVLDYNSRSNGAKDYLNLADDVINHRLMADQETLACR